MQSQEESLEIHFKNDNVKSTWKQEQEPKLE